MITKQELLNAIGANIENYPDIAQLYQAKDPGLLWQLESIAAMLSSYSQELEVAALEPFDKVRDSTILADAAMRGIVPRGKPARVRIKVNNNNTEAYSITAGRNLLDSNGNLWVVIAPLTLAPNSDGVLEADQYSVTILNHKVTESMPFYAVKIPESKDGSFFYGLQVSDVDGEYSYRERYVNALPDEKIYHLEVDNRQNLFARFGFENVVGVQPKAADEITFNVAYTLGANAKPKIGTPFSVVYIASTLENNIEFKLEAVIREGQNPLTMDVLRDLSRYPAVYDFNAVYLGEFEYLVKRNVADLLFLSVWNEQQEEQVRGASVDNINTLFVACVSTAESESTITNILQLAPITTLTTKQAEIKSVILGADNSYKVVFYPALIQRVTVTITAKISTNYIQSDVYAEIKTLILRHYGKQAGSAKRTTKPTHYDIYQLITKQITAFKAGKPELIISVSELAENHPEAWMFVDDNSLHINIETTNTIAPMWGY